MTQAALLFEQTYVIIENFESLLCNKDDIHLLGSELFHNYVSYHALRPFSACGWVNMHCDMNFDSPNIWQIYPMYWSDDAIFVHRKDGKLVAVEPCLTTIVFKRTALHGVLPRDLALEVVNKQSIRFIRYKRWLDSIEGRRYKPKLVWSWT